jgi:three-Cys-motif partner protein
LVARQNIDTSLTPDEQRLLSELGSDIPKLDEVGYWSEAKLEIVAKYSKGASRILRSSGFKSLYVDGFAGAGVHKSRRTGKLIAGSPLLVSRVQPPFERIELVEQDPERVALLRSQFAEDRRVQVHHGDANDLVPRIVKGIARNSDWRAVVLLDPYKLNLKWGTIRGVGATRAADMLIHLPTMQIQRNVVRRTLEAGVESEQQRMTELWGGTGWQTAAYREEETLFGSEESKAGILDIAHAFRERLIEPHGAGFKFCSRPVPMRNNGRRVIYYLLLASQVDVAVKVFEDVTRDYR